MADGVVLVDSSVWIEAIAPKAPGALKATLKALLDTSRVVTTDMVRLEVVAGARSVREFETFRADFDAIPCLEVVRREWRMAEDLSLTLGRHGRRVAAPDLLIAAAALAHGVPLWHADSDFERVRTAASAFHTFWYPKQSPEP